MDFVDPDFRCAAAVFAGDVRRDSRRIKSGKLVAVVRSGGDENIGTAFGRMMF